MAVQDRERRRAAAAGRVQSQTLATAFVETGGTPHRSGTPSHFGQSGRLARTMDAELEVPVQVGGGRAPHGSMGNNFSANKVWHLVSRLSTCSHSGPYFRRGQTVWRSIGGGCVGSLVRSRRSTCRGGMEQPQDHAPMGGLR